ncbi:MAG: MFS transporter [Halanaerobiales bacterium]|nr:MFS transporter [Halanaerobiales bacterium]
MKGSGFAVGTVLLGICNSLFNPAIGASIPNLVKDEHLTQANSLEHLSMNVTGMAGPALGGILIGLYDISGVFMINGISFLISALSEVFIKFPPQRNTNKDKKITFFADIKEGVSFIYKKKALFHLMFACPFANFLYAGCGTVAMPLIARNALGVSVMEFGLIEAAWPIGAALGGLILTMLPEFKKAFKIFTVSLSIQTLFFSAVGIIILPKVITAIGVDFSMLSVIILFIIAGIFNAFVNIPIFVIFQRMIPDEIRGRIFALLGTLSQGLVPVSIGLTGIIADLILPNYIFMFAGIGMIVIIINFIMKKEVREI